MFGLDRVEHRHRVLRPQLDGRKLAAAERVGEPDPPRVEANQPSERRQTAVEARPVRFVVAVDPDEAAVVQRQEVDRTVTEHPIADEPVAALRVLRLGTLHQGGGYGRASIGADCTD